MFTFRKTTLAFFILFFLLNILRIAGIGIHLWHFLLLIAVYLSVSVAFSFFIRSGFHMKAFCRAETDEKIVSITFDDGPDFEFTGRLLDSLKNHGIKATFFCIGKKVDGNETLIKRMDSEGHLVGMHSYSHSAWFDFFPSGKMKKEFEKSEEKIKRIIGKRPVLFRPPYGVINPMVRRALSGTGYHVIGFSKRAWDTTACIEDKILARITRNLKPGDILLLHDTVMQNINVLEGIVKWTSANGFRIVPLDKLLKLEAYEKP